MNNDRYFQKQKKNKQNPKNLDKRDKDIGTICAFYISIQFIKRLFEMNKDNVKKSNNEPTYGNGRICI